jgi:hypothetical protein
MASDFYDNLKIVWNALEEYRENCIPEGQKQYDEKWNDICTAMALITEDLENIPKR